MFYCTIRNCVTQKLCEPLAQSVEHLTFNQGVEGSIPSWLTKLLKTFKIF